MHCITFDVIGIIDIIYIKCISMHRNTHHFFEMLRHRILNIETRRLLVQAERSKMYKSSTQKSGVQVIPKSPLESETGCSESEFLTLESEFKSESSSAKSESEFESLKSGLELDSSQSPESEYYKSVD
jgi:hypothetical protein